MGCSQETETMFVHQGQIMAQARGLVLASDGQEGMAGMYGTTCVFNANNGQMGQDYDLEGDDEVVEDSNASGIVLTRSDSGIHEVAPFGGEFDASDVPTWQTDPGNDDAFVSTELAGVLAARWVGGEPVALASSIGQCALHGLGQIPYTVALDGNICAGFRDMAVNPTTGQMYLGTAVGLFSADESSASLWADVDVEAMSWDAASQAMYIITDDGMTLQARNVDGSMRWQHRSVGGLTALTHMGPQAAVTTMERDGEGRGILAVYDGATGDVVESVDTPAAGSDMAISENGATLAIAVEQFIHLFSVEPQ